MDRVTRRAFLARAALGAAGVALAPAVWPGSPAWGRPAPPADLIERNDWPPHWETSLATLGRSWLTPNHLFFVRCHLPVPELEPADYRLEVTGRVRTPLSLTLAELRGLAGAERTCVLECAGNGRALYRLPSTSGTQWEHGAVGNARWAGAPLAAVLSRAGLLPEARHVWLEAADQAPFPQTPRFLRSIPIEKAMDDVLLAHTMNGEPLPAFHGAPLRAVVPGWYAMASTKWVTALRVEDRPSDNHFMVNGYRYSYPGVEPAHAEPVTEIRVKSVVTSVRPGRERGTWEARGLAWAGPAGVARVEVSVDGGGSWSAAERVGESQPAAWRAWRAVVRAPDGARIAARATDGAGSVQPVAARANAGGYANNSIMEVPLRAA
jgi:DMSO/TMAO reductase YedYZ molybdopterin-dependent catalytic subunit